MNLDCDTASPTLLLAALILCNSGCDPLSPPDEPDSETFQRTAAAPPIPEPAADASDHAWIVPEAQAPQAENPDFTVDDAVVLDELDLPNGARAQIVELPEDAGVGIIWQGAPLEIGGLPAAHFSPLELSQAFGTYEAPPAELALNHDSLASAGRVPSRARDLLALGTTTDPSRSTLIDNDTLCPVWASSYWFNQLWGYYRQTCPDGTLCGSLSNDHSAVVSGNYYIVVPASSKTAMQACNAGTPIGTLSNDAINAQIQYYAGSGNWHTFYTGPGYVTEEGIAFSYYGLSINRFRMRIYNANADTDSLAAAIW